MTHYGSFKKNSIKHRITMWLCNSTSGHITKEKIKECFCLFCFFGGVVFWFFCLFGFFFLWLYLWHMEVPWLGVELELQLPAYTSATETPDPIWVCDLHHSSWQCRIPDPLFETRHWTSTLMVTSWIPFHCTNGNSCFFFFSYLGLSYYLFSYA